MENGPFEDVLPIENGDIPASYVSLPEGSGITLPFQRSKFTNRSLQSCMATLACPKRRVAWVGCRDLRWERLHKATKSCGGWHVFFFCESKFWTNRFISIRSVGIYKDVIRPYQITSFFFWLESPWFQIPFWGVSNRWYITHLDNFRPTYHRDLWFLPLHLAGSTATRVTKW